MKDKYYKKLDLIRVIACISILFYHIGILKGGYLAVCTFFVLTSYFSVVSFYKKNEFSFKEYYINKFKKIYLPLFIVVFLTIAVTSLIKSINFTNYKPEVTSILFGYNNYWQLDANLDYFVRHISSPFMHLWFIAIVLQFELIIPFVLKILDKTSKKINKFLPCFILFIISVVSYVLFYVEISNGNLMNAYYGSITRLFSLSLGLLIGFIHVHYKPLIIKNYLFKNVLFRIYLLTMIFFFIFIDFKSNLFSISMLIVTLITLRLIDYGTNIKNNGSFDKVVSFFSKISYEIYLVQYPVIFIFQNIKLASYIKIPLIILITILLSLIIKKSLNIKEKYKIKLTRVFLLIIILLGTIFGFYKYIITKDYTKEMKKLESDLNKNSELIKERQKEYLEKLKKEEDEWKNTLNDLNSNEEQIKEKIRNLHIVGIGDSIMELAIKDLYNEFPKGYFDAKVNRTTYQVNDILKDLINKNILGDVVVFNIGTNGEFYQKYTDEIMKTLGDRKVFWLNATNADYPDFNDKLTAFANRYNNIHIIDWVSVVKKHPEYIISDKVHPTIRGCKVYAETIFNAIYEEYLNELKKEKQEKIKEHEQIENSKITFIGNDLLLGIYKHLEQDYKDASFIIDKSLDYKSLKKKLKNNKLNHKLVFVFDSKTHITKDDYNELSKLYKDNEIYIVITSNTLNIDNKDIKEINFFNQLKNNKKYITSDGIHLTDQGNKKLKETIDIHLK